MLCMCVKMYQKKNTKDYLQKKWSRNKNSIYLFSLKHQFIHHRDCFDKFVEYRRQVLDISDM